MPTLENAQEQSFVKMVMIGDPGTGKTGALGSLVKSGYKLRVWDFDNKIAGGILPIVLKRECPEKLKDVEYVELRDEYSAANASNSKQGYIGTPKAWQEAIMLLDKWTDGSSPQKWGHDYIAVFDSLTFAGDAAFNWISAMNPSVKDPRNWFFTAQNCMESMLAKIASASFRCHVIAISHVDWKTRPDGTMKGYPSSLGSALNPRIPAYFENMALCETNAGKRYIRTVPTALVDLKNPAAFKMLPQLPIETGLADFFKTLRS